MFSNPPLPGENNQAEIQNRVGEAMFIATLMGLLGMLLLNFLPTMALNLVLSPTSGARVYSEPYLKIRALTFIPALLSVNLT